MKNKKKAREEQREDMKVIKADVKKGIVRNAIKANNLVVVTDMSFAEEVKENDKLAAPVTVVDNQREYPGFLLIAKKNVDRKIRVNVRLFLHDEGLDQLAEDVLSVKWKENEKATRVFELPPPSCCSCCAAPPPKNTISLDYSEFKKEELKGKNSASWVSNVEFYLPANLQSDHILKLPLIFHFALGVEVPFYISIGAQVLPEGVKASGKQLIAQIRAKIPDWVVEVVKDSLMGILSNALTALVVI